MNLLIVTDIIQNWQITNFQNLFITDHILQIYSLHFKQLSYTSNTAIIYLTKHNVYI